MLKSSFYTVAFDFFGPSLVIMIPRIVELQGPIMTHMHVNGYSFALLLLIATYLVKAKIHTLSQISLSGLSTVCYKTTLNTGSVGWAGAVPPTYKLGKLLS